MIKGIHGISKLTYSLTCILFDVCSSMLKERNLDLLPSCVLSFLNTKIETYLKSIDQSKGTWSNKNKMLKFTLKTRLRKDQRISRDFRIVCYIQIIYEFLMFLIWIHWINEETFFNKCKNLESLKFGCLQLLQEHDIVSVSHIGMVLLVTIYVWVSRLSIMFFIRES